MNSKMRSHFYNVGIRNIRTPQCTLQLVHQQINTAVCLGVITAVQRFWWHKQFFCQFHFTSREYVSTYMDIRNFFKKITLYPLLAKIELW